MSSGTRPGCGAATVGWLGAVPAGGASTRMGVDKAFIEVDGVPMVARAAAAMTAAGAAAVLVIGGDPARLADLGLPSVPDRHPGEGPLGAVITALDALGALEDASIEAVVTLPCDVIRPEPASLRAVIGGLGAGPATGVAAAPEADVVVPLASGAPQWMHAAWRRRCLPILSEAFDRGIRAPKDAAGLLRVAEVEIVGAGWSKDADRPEDLPAGVRPRASSRTARLMPDRTDD